MILKTSTVYKEKLGLKHTHTYVITKVMSLGKNNNKNKNSRLHR